jgi:hypothetical protein
MATRNRYQEIMAQYQQAQPFSFTGYPSSYGNQSDYSGGYDNTPYIEPVEQTPYVGLIDDQYTGVRGGGGGGGGYSSSPEGQAEKTFAMENMSEKDIAIQRAINNAIGTGIDSFGNLSPVVMGLKGIFGPKDGGGGGYSGAPSAGSDVGRSAPGSAHSGQQGYAQGGHVSMMHLLGPDPEGPDDGYATLKDGEFVINDKAVKKYGIELMNAINSGKISKGKLLGLLEM